MSAQSRSSGNVHLFASASNISFLLFVLSGSSQVTEDGMYVAFVSGIHAAQVSHGKYTLPFVNELPYFI